MSIYQLDDKDKIKIADLFDGWNETLIWSCLQGFMGTAWTNHVASPKSAQIVIADFCFLAGEINEELVRNRPQGHKSDFVIMIPQNEAWAKLIERIYGENATKVTRYAIKKEPDVFEVKRLEIIVQNLDEDYEIRLIDKEIFDIIKENKWSYDLCSQFENFDVYQKNGVGIVVLHKGEVVSGASSYSIYREGIEIEIDTREDYRRKGLALVCGARLILECIQKGLYPSWDAQNRGSVALAEKLGYHFDHEYIAYEISCFGMK